MAFWLQALISGRFRENIVYGQTLLPVLHSLKSFVPHGLLVYDEFESYACAPVSYPCSQYRIPVLASIIPGYADNSAAIVSLLGFHPLFIF